MQGAWRVDVGFVLGLDILVSLIYLYVFAYHIHGYAVAVGADKLACTIGKRYANVLGGFDGIFVNGFLAISNDIKLHHVYASLTVPVDAVFSLGGGGGTSSGIA